MKELITISIAKRTLFAFFIAAQLLLAAASTQAKSYQPISTQNSVVGGDLNKTVTIVQEGTNTLDRFEMTKVVKPASNQAVRAVMLLLPPLGSGFQNYEVGEMGTITTRSSRFLRAETSSSTVTRNVCRGYRQAVAKAGQSIARPCSTGAYKPQSTTRNTYAIRSQSSIPAST